MADLEEDVRETGSLSTKLVSNTSLVFFLSLQENGEVDEEGEENEATILDKKLKERYLSRTSC